MIISLRGVNATLSFYLAFRCTNNQAEYEALVIGLEILLKLRAKDVHWTFTIGTSTINMKYNCNSLLLTPYFTAAIQKFDSFDNVEVEHVPRESNREADSTVKMGEELTHKLTMIEKKNHPSIFERGIDLDIFKNDMNIAGDSRA